MTAALARLAPKPRRSVPAPGSSLVAATETYAVHVRAAVEAVRRSFGDHESVGAAWADVLASRWSEEPLAASGALPLQAAWGLVAMRVVGRSIGALSANASLRDAEAWFLGRLHPPACSPMPSSSSPTARRPGRSRRSTTTTRSGISCHTCLTRTAPAAGPA